MKGYIHSTESFGSVDGPGIRFVIFLKGCHMRCRYCHNPDTWQTGGKDTADGGIDPEQLLDRAERYRSYWGREGGITVSGGEALLQTDFLIELFEEAHRRGIHTCLDTSGQPFTRCEPFFSKFERMMQSTDLLLLDLKHIDDDRHRQLTGHGNTSILECARYLSDIQKPVWIRHVLVPGWTDEDTQLYRLRQFINTLDNVERVEVLPYHTLGIHKWKQLGIDYTLSDTQPPSKERIENARKILCG